MHNLNSILLEGRVISPIVSKDKIEFALISKVSPRIGEAIKADKDGEFPYEEQGFIVIVSERASFYERVKDKLREGISVRVVGGLRNENNRVYIEAEHVEMRV